MLIFPLAAKKRENILPLRGRIKVGGVGLVYLTGELYEIGVSVGGEDNSRRLLTAYTDATLYPAADRMVKPRMLAADIRHKFLAKRGDYPTQAATVKEGTAAIGTHTDNAA